MEIDGYEDVLEGMQGCLLPSPDKVVWEADGKVRQVELGFFDHVAHYASSLLMFSFYAVVFPFACLYSMGKYTVELIQGKKEEPVIPTGAPNPSALPEHFGFATSHFQDFGLGTDASPTPLAGVCDWQKWLNPERIEGTEDGNYEHFFFEALRNPQPFIDLLKEMHVSAHRFSMEWSVIEPQKGQIDMEAVGLYRNFIQKLEENGIEPYVTLHHFVCPEWFAQDGGFDNLENIEVFKTHALKMMELFPEVTNWMPFNEINVDATQKSVRGVYPPGEVGNMAMAGRMMRHMLIAHCQIYKEAKERWNHLQIGSTHQWLNFEPLEGNPLERVICFYLAKIFHYATYNFFRTGVFHMDVPGKANVQFQIPKEEFARNNGFSDFMGVQWYGYPRLKAGFNGGQDYPGYKINNIPLGPLGGLTFGATCPPGGRTMSFGPGFYPESLDKCLTEAEELGKPLVITEWGCDAVSQGFGEEDFNLNFQAQRDFYESCYPIFEKHADSIKGMFAWTVAQDDLEWDRGNKPMLGIVKILKDRDRNMVGHELSPAAELVKDLYTRKSAEIAARRAAAAA